MHNRHAELESCLVDAGRQGRKHVMDLEGLVPTLTLQRAEMTCDLGVMYHLQRSLKALSPVFAQKVVRGVFEPICFEVISQIRMDPFCGGFFAPETLVACKYP